MPIRSKHPPKLGRRNSVNLQPDPGIEITRCWTEQGAIPRKTQLPACQAAFKSLAGNRRRLYDWYSPLGSNSATNKSPNYYGKVGKGAGSEHSSPLTTPLTFDLVEHMAEGEYARLLDGLETQGGGAFLMLCVIFPSLLGAVVRPALGEERMAPAKPILKLFNCLNLLVLNYSNASVSLPKAMVGRDWDFLGVILVIVVGMCLLAFAAGWCLGRLFRIELPQRTSLMFGLGMNNNGTGLVLATMVLSDYPHVMLPIICYNLVQHLVAGGVHFLLLRTVDLGEKGTVPQAGLSAETNLQTIRSDERDKLPDHCLHCQIPAKA